MSNTPAPPRGRGIDEAAVGGEIAENAEIAARSGKYLGLALSVGGDREIAGLFIAVTVGGIEQTGAVRGPDQSEARRF